MWSLFVCVIQSAAIAPATSAAVPMPELTRIERWHAPASAGRAVGWPRTVPVTPPDSLGAAPLLTRQIMVDGFFVMEHFADSVVAHPDFTPPAVLNALSGQHGEKNPYKVHRKWYLSTKYDFSDTSVDFLKFTDTVSSPKDGKQGEELQYQGIFPIDLRRGILSGFPTDSVARTIAAVPMFAGVLSSVHVTPIRFAQITAAIQQTWLAQFDYYNRDIVRNISTQ